MPTLLVLGPAGSGKTTLVRALYHHVKKSRVYSNIIACNLDPGSDDATTWEIDVRKKFTVKQIMAEHGLGPNGAITKAYELLAGSIEPLFGALEEDSSTLVILDAPGQLEPLIFSEMGNRFLDALKLRFPGMIAAFLLPGEIINQPSSYAFLLLTLTGLHLKIHVPVIHAISKADLLTSTAREYITSSDALKARLIEENAGQMTDFASKALDIIEHLLPGVHLALITVTKKKQEGLDDLLDLLDEAKCSCGDLT